MGMSPGIGSFDSLPFLRYANFSACLPSQPAILVQGLKRPYGTLEAVKGIELWVHGWISPAVALQAATYNAARLLRAENRLGLIAPGHDADLLIVDGNPLEDISVTERISLVVFKGERLDRAELFDQR